MEAIDNVNDLRRILSEEIAKIRSGETTAANVNAIVNATGKILTTVKMEIEYNKLIGKVPDIGFITAGKSAADSKNPSALNPASEYPTSIG